MSRASPTPLDDPMAGARSAVLHGKYRQAMDALDALPAEVRGSPEARLLLAMASWRSGDYQRSRTAALEAGDGFRRGGDFDGVMRADNVAAAAAFALGDLDAAERGFERTMTLADRRHDMLMMGRCANNLGNIAYYRAAALDALSHYRLAIASFEGLGFTHGLAEAWLNSALVLREAGDLAASRDAADRAIGLAEYAGAARLKAQAMAAAAETALEAGDLPLALSLCGRATRLAEAEDDLLNVADAERIRARIDRRRGRLDEAWASAERAVAIARRLGHLWSIAESEAELAELALTGGRKEEAMTRAEHAAEAFGRLGSTTRANAVRRLVRENSLQ
ncbi:MAG TPA: hypothetical protein VGA22_14435 [Gemmatimonadales bacterium]